MTAPAPAAAPAIPAQISQFLLDGLRFATVATISPDGSVHQAVVWFDIDDGAVVLNSAEGRRWPSNLRRDPRISLVVEDGYRWVSLQGTVEIVDDRERAQADIAGLSRRYHPNDPDIVEQEVRRFQAQKRVTFLLRPTAIHAELAED